MKNIKLSDISCIAGNYYIANGEDLLLYIFCDKDIPIGMHLLLYLLLYNYRKLNPNAFDIRTTLKTKNNCTIQISAVHNKG